MTVDATSTNQEVYQTICIGGCYANKCRDRTLLTERPFVDQKEMCSLQSSRL